MTQPAPRLTPREQLQIESLLRSLVDARTAPTIERQLTAGYSHAELARVGFEEVSLGQCSSRLAAAIVAQRERPLEHATEAELDAAARLFFATQREVHVGRNAGTASCMPTMR